MFSLQKVQKFSERTYDSPTIIWNLWADEKLFLNILFMCLQKTWSEEKRRKQVLSRYGKSSIQQNKQGQRSWLFHVVPSPLLLLLNMLLFKIKELIVDPSVFPVHRKVLGEIWERGLLWKGMVKHSKREVMDFSQLNSDDKVWIKRSKGWPMWDAHLLLSPPTFLCHT